MFGLTSGKASQNEYPPMLLPSFIQTAIDSYDVSDLVHQATILLLFIALILKTSVRFRWKRPASYY